jgi:hypothetical protein
LRDNNQNILHKLLIIILFLPLCSIYRHGSHDGWSVGLSDVTFKVNPLRMIQAKFGLNWPRKSCKDQMQSKPYGKNAYVVFFQNFDWRPPAVIQRVSLLQKIENYCRIFFFLIPVKSQLPPNFMEMMHIWFTFRLTIIFYFL